MARRLDAEGVPTVTGAPWSRGMVRKLALLGPTGPRGVDDEQFAVSPAAPARARRARLA
jgi:hypothetical protein